jgi:multidrug efflux system membrane fusion protein
MMTIRFRLCSGTVQLLLPLLAVASAAACGTEAKPRNSTTGAKPADAAHRSGPSIPVVTAPVAVKTMPVTIDAVGTAEAISTVEIRAQVAGQLRRIFFTPGDDVRKGQPLFALDAQPFEAAVHQAEAVVARDAAQANAAKAQRTRFEDLFSRGLIPRDQFEAQAATAAALEASLAADRAQLEQARLNVQYSRISAPIDGRTGELMIHVGDLVRANDTNPLVTIKRLSPIYVTFSVPARFLSDIQHYAAQTPLAVRVRQQAAAGVSPDTHPATTPPPPSGLDVEGTVTFIDNAVDPTTATIRLKATFPNAGRELWPGLFVQVSLQLRSQQNAVVVPAVAVQPSQKGQYVYVVKHDRTVEMRAVSVDRQQGDEAVIGDGLKGGEEVVTDGQLRLTPGARVTTQNRKATAS